MLSCSLSQRILPNLEALLATSRAVVEPGQSRILPQCFLEYQVIVLALI